MPKTWFITGASKGFGLEWAEAALERGDRVAVTSRSESAFDDLVAKYGDAVLPLRLDVVDRDAAFEAVQQTVDTFGGLDVVINNAGYGLFGMTEEVTEQQAREQIDVNVFGALWVTQAVLPHLRARRSGHIIQVSSIGGVVSLPGLGLYHASKFALEGFTASLAAEVKGFGIKVTLVEPAGYATEWAGPSAVQAQHLPAYDDFRAAMTRIAARRGDPSATRAAILTVVDAEQPPLRIFFGEGPLELITKEYGARLDEWRKWDDISKLAFGA
ncbi:SDR family NAD(P)-dependent oxidoreductase [Streptomyces sp. MBT53]|uniref:SDR family NAD(P)-dependent oxidoreductase n=1 Tax=Streptomyces sp. MBT53 TaxID=1488384 RepID=UPI001913F0A9|nr:SDR family NAD(P)-dependent oxidoreductase [Streptomyces sp. MBT53]MBK6010386.1 SDR family NAD(P)-dependent oxidoreductase [Streptomyces sp. MBT53]